MSKGISGLFHGTLGSSYVNGSQNNDSYFDRGIEISEHIKEYLAKLKKKGDTVSGPRNAFSMKDASVMSKETGVEYACVSIGDKSFLIRGDKKGAVVPNYLRRKMKKHKGTLDFHSHPYDNDCVPSGDDTETLRELRRLTGQTESIIVTPNGRTVTFGEYGVISTGTVPNLIDEELKKAYMDFWR